MLRRYAHGLVKAPVPDVQLQGDPVRLAQVFSNILTNAAKFTPPQGRVELSADRSGECIRVTVRDSGRGIAPEDLTRIFEPSCSFTASPTRRAVAWAWGWRS